jgi:uncharacterized membrane protein (DUF485 family)
MSGFKFTHVEIFKIILTAVYIASGLVMFGIFISNATNEFTKSNKTVKQEQVNCMNCDEID